MRETMFYNHVIEEHTDKATKSRLYRGHKIEEIMKCSLETIVSSEEKMEAALVRLRKEQNSGDLINSLNHYYHAEHGKAYKRYKDPKAGAAYVRHLLENRA